MSTSQTLNWIIKFSTQRGLEGLLITVCPPWPHTQGNGALGSEGHPQWHYALGGCLVALRISDSVSEQCLKTASMRTVHLMHALLFCSNFPSLF